MKSWRNYFVWASALLVWQTAMAEPATVTGDRVNVRAANKPTAEVLLQLSQGDQVDLLEALPAPAAAAETVAFVKIRMPAAGVVWVAQNMLDATGAVVAKNNVNLRAGPGTNFSVVGKINKGEQIQVVKKEGDWVQIKPTANCWAFIAARYLHAGITPGIARPAPPPALIAAAPAAPTPSAPPAAVTPPPAAPPAPVTPPTEPVAVPTAPAAPAAAVTP
ncbi:MAG: SH3 domain-containing protein, partial [Verrucomicrobia bacterium]|nr:SH3 domain-containing protein [Verrucomicrobiota bacterium]